METSAPTGSWVDGLTELDRRQEYADDDIYVLTSSQNTMVSM